MKRLLHYPVLSGADLGLIRSPGPGLGNLLFPLARAVVGRERHGGRVVVPTMRQLKVGPFVRRESDKRTYGDILRPRTHAEWQDWIRAQYRIQSNCGRKETASSVIRYKGLGSQFHDLAGHSETIKDFLLSIARESCTIPTYDIAMHIRLGDFSPAKHGEQDQNTRLPFEWYTDALHVARQLLDKGPLRCVLFTDDDPEAIIAKLKLQDFAPEPVGNALTKIFALSHARLLIGSRSTFSLWGQFLGSSQAIWPAGFDLGRYKPIEPHADRFV